MAKNDVEFLLSIWRCLHSSNSSEARVMQVADLLASIREKLFDDPGDKRLALNSSAVAGKAEQQTSIEHIVPDVVRLSLLSPYPDVSMQFASFLHELKLHGYQWTLDINNACPSGFVPHTEFLLPSVELLSKNVRLQRLYELAFNIWFCRLDHMTIAMALHVDYLKIFLETLMALFHNDSCRLYRDFAAVLSPSDDSEHGAVDANGFFERQTAGVSGCLSKPERYYIAIMAAARHRCDYLVHILAVNFLAEGGPLEWLGADGLQAAPPKLRELDTVNRLLAHRPWLLCAAHFQQLQPFGWSAGALIEAVVVLALFHSLCGFVFGCGLNGELDAPEVQRPGSGSGDSGGAGARVARSSPPRSGGGEEAEGRATAGDSVSSLLERMHLLRLEAESLERSAPDDDAHAEGDASDSSDTDLPTAARASSRFTTQCQFGYVDFYTRQPLDAGVARDGPGAPDALERPRTVKSGEWDWSLAITVLLDRRFDTLASVLERKFDVIKRLTYHTMSHVGNVDTANFRLSIWYYVQLLFGFRHDDWDYHITNVLVGHSYKCFIKNLVVRPETIGRADYERFMHDFQHSEKIHVCLIAFEARFQAELMYALRAINSH